MREIKQRQVTVVTVTYGDRRQYLQEVLRAVFDAGVARAVVVNNAAVWDVDGLEDVFGDAVDVVDMNANTGSAGGYAAGIQRALDIGAEYIWLLDDDNRPTVGCLSRLVSAYESLHAEVPAHDLAVLAFRPEHQADVASGVPAHRINARPSSFQGFHFFDIPYKFWRRTRWGRPRLRGSLPEIVNLDVAPYSGLFFHRAVAEVIGLPRVDLVLYGDDTEYTYRLVRAGGRIALVTGAALEDLESSWNVRRDGGSTFRVLLHQGSDLRAYYGMRNRAYFDAHCLARNPLMFALNRGLYIVALAVLAVAGQRTDRYKLLREAFNHGLAGQLGVHTGLPLS